MRPFLTIAACCLALACNSPAGTDKKQRTPDSVVMIPTDTMIHITDTTVTPALIESWKTFEKFNGKYAADIRLLDQKPLKARLKEMLGTEEADFVARYKVTPPLEVDAGVLFNEGCKPHNCGVEEAAIAIDMKKDVIYIGIARNKAVKLYGEKGDVAYPERLMQWMMKFEEK
ncbi:hypothetical protein ACFOTA_04095 [Chitinophaga sp. GCM10012297]|uniref:Uncharacterized protein n=1 Tax=Chitinophaga chungangae TaxID=2821488 RepID=A0ABS3YB45_9BACT|nr:hypothetical protein [Chitinophaga chungangae]MBO9151374.1 hypothetical protein [Chitinophaga chungangae]